MEIINLGATDGLPPVNWESVLEKLGAGSPPDQTPTTLARRGFRR